MKKRGLQLFALPLIVLALVALVRLPLSASAASSSATSQHQPHFLYQQGHLQPNVGSNLQYGSGPVMGGTMNVYAIFWEPTDNVSSTYHNLIERYFNDVGSSGLYHNNTQYTDSSGNVPLNTHLAATWVDHTTYPERPLLDSDIQNEVTSAQSANNWSSGIDNIFFVFTEAGEDICTDSSQSQCTSNAFCAYHNYFGTDTIYAAIPYAASFSCKGGQGPNGDQATDETINVTSHEQMEVATDPLLNAWIDSSGQEIGDKCAWKFGTTSADGSNVNWNGHPYLVQEEWDNAQSGCVLTGP